MRKISDPFLKKQWRQQEIQARCFHPSRVFFEFPEEAIDMSIPARFEEQVLKYPESIAVKTKKHEISYGDLNKDANRIARGILDICDSGAEPIALLMEKDGPLFAAILGALKAGKVYVPLDPLYPRNRIAYMLGDVGARLILTDEQNLPLAEEMSGNTRVLMNIDRLSSDLSDENLGLTIAPDAFAFILYTSGSTGQPKGIIQNHRNVLHETMNYTNGLRISPHDRLTLLESCSFGGAVRNTFGALLNGAALFPLNIKRDGLAHLDDWLAEEKITVYRSVESVFHGFASNLKGDREFRDLRIIYLGGEPVYRRDVDLYKKHFSKDCIFINGLGTTETWTFRWLFIDHDSEIVGSNTPVGYALPGKKLVVIEISQIGELEVKSRFISPGYWRRDELTRKAFLVDPKGEGERVYRTGDMGRMEADGCLEHLGRTDLQVKVRGHRIEVSEIETALLEIDQIKEAVVVARKGVDGNQRLVAHLTVNGQAELGVGQLRKTLTDKLPDYMVPSVFVRLDQLPLTATGKVDRRALQEPDRRRPNLESPYVGPRTPIEHTLTRIWAEVLDVDRVGVHDNFLDLGGDSLLASQVIARALNFFQVEVPLGDLLKAPTVEEMVLVIVQKQALKADPEDIERLLVGLEGPPNIQ